MATSKLNGGVVSNGGNRQLLTVISRDNASTFATDWQRFACTDIVAQVNGTATDIVAVVERSATNPDAETAQAAPADDDGFAGDLSAGIAPNVYQEAGVGWWRISVTTNTGGACTASLSGLG